MRGHAARAKSSAIPERTLHGQIEVQIAVQSRKPRRPPPGRYRVFARIADALERLAPQRTFVPDLTVADAFVWHPDGRRLAPVKRVNRVEMSLLKGIDLGRDVLVENTERFAKGLPANNALLWGARGMGKSSLVKASHAGVNVALARQVKRPRSSSSRSTARTSRACRT